jgi:glycerol-3-phosphate dehydrogenase
MTGARVENGLWQVDLREEAGGVVSTVQARALVNAAGPWAGSLLHGIGGVAHEGGIRLVKGSHIIVPPLYKGDHAFILQNPDGRIVFTIPYQKRFTLVGTTDVLVDEAERARPRISAEDRIPLRTVSEYFERQVAPADVVSTYSGVRPLYDDGGDDAKAITRDYVLKLGREEGPQLLSVFGGKLTTYRRLAEHALEKLAPFLPAMGPAWTGAGPLPGGDLPGGDFDAFLQTVRARWPFLPADTAERVAHAYGTRVEEWLGGAEGWNALGEDFGAGLTAAEVDYLCAQEWARTAEDILWRRTKLGLVCPSDTAERLARYLARRAGHETAAAPMAASGEKGNGRAYPRARSGHHVHAGAGVRRGSPRDRQRAAGIPPAIPASRLGRTRCGGHLARYAGLREAGAGSRRTLCGGHRGDRRHQPARNHRAVGPQDGQAAAQRDCLAGPAHRRSLRRAARCRP